MSKLTLPGRCPYCPPGCCESAVATDPSSIYQTWHVVAQCGASGPHETSRERAVHAWNSTPRVEATEDGDVVYAVEIRLVEARVGEGGQLDALHTHPAETMGRPKPTKQAALSYIDAVQAMAGRLEP